MIRTFHWQDIVEGAPLLWAGFQQTLILAGAAIGMSLLLGTLLGIFREERYPVLGRLSAVLIEFIRSIPLILFLVFVHYGLMPLFFDRPGFLFSSLVAFSVFEAAYIAEIVRSGLRAIRTAERDAAISLGFTYRQRMLYIFLPLAFRRMMPALVSQFISLLKDTSLASIVGVIELTRAGEILYEQTFHDFEVLVFIALVYFMLCFGLSCLSRRLETPEYATQQVSLSGLQG